MECYTIAPTSQLQYNLFIYFTQSHNVTKNGDAYYCPYLHQILTNNKNYHKAVNKDPNTP